MNITPPRIDFEDWHNRCIAEIAVLSIEAGVTREEQREARSLMTRLDLALGVQMPVLRVVGGRDAG